MTVPERGHTSQLGIKPTGHTSQGRGGRGDRGGRRPPVNRMEPARALSGDGGHDDVDDLDDDLDPEAVERGEAAVEGPRAEPGPRRRDDNRRPPILGREDDRSDLPAILETEAGDEAADELADEETRRGPGRRARPHRRPAAAAPAATERTGAAPRAAAAGGAAPVRTATV